MRNQNNNESIYRFALVNFSIFLSLTSAFFFTNNRLINYTTILITIIISIYIIYKFAIDEISKSNIKLIQIIIVVLLTIIYSCIMGLRLISFL